MKKRHFLTYLCIFLFFIGLILLNDILAFGERLVGIGTWLQYVFYATVIFVVIWFIVIPIIKVVKAPEITGTPLYDIDTITPGKLAEYIKKLKLSNEEKKELREAIKKKEALRCILKEREQIADKTVKEAAQNILLLTAISQNGAFDVISSIAMNLGMIKNLIKLSGFRPSFPQLLRLYFSVFSSSLIIMSVDKMIEEIDLGEIFTSAGVGIGNIFFKSIGNGIMNALVCLRVGYTTLKYLQMGGKQFRKNRSEIQGDVRSKAIGALGSVVKSSYQKGKKVFVNET